MSLEDALTALRAANRISGSRASYRKDNPGEYEKVISYLDGGPRPADAGTFTQMGRGLVLVEDERRVASPPPPTGAKLSWAPPDYSGFEKRTISNSQRSHIVPAGSDRNALFTISERITAGVVDIRGFNHVVLIGGELDPQHSSPGGKCLQLYGNDGIVHLEGLLIRGKYVHDNIGLSMGRTPQSGAPGGTLRLQNCRIENSWDSNLGGGGHADNVQLWTTWGGAPSGYVGGCGPVQIDRLTCVTFRQALFFGNHDGALGDLDIRNVDLRMSSDPRVAWGGHVLFKTYRKDPYGRASHMKLQDVWVQGNSGLSKRDWVVPDDQGGYDGSYTEASRANKLGSDAGGEYLYWESTADVSGTVRLGRPPDGDFVPASAVGMGYVSPGYV
jgi:hypothetical protein